MLGIKLLYVCYTDLSGPGMIGIKKKILQQIGGLRSLNCKVELIYRKSNGLVIVDDHQKETEIPDLIKDYRLMNSEVFINKFLIKWVGKHKYDALYIRPAIFGGSTYRFFKKLYENKIKVIVELPTYPYFQENLHTIKLNFLKGRFIFAAKKLVAMGIDYFIIPRITRYIDRFVTFSPEETIWDVPTIKTSNGVNLEATSKKTCLNPIGTINLVAVSTCNIWHGYDRIIEGMGKYYTDGGKRDIVLNLVGEGAELEKYKGLTEKYKLSEKVLFYGFLNGKALDQIYDKSDIGLDALGRHRVGVYYNSTIKGKEYVAKGLPIISGVKTELDYIENFDYYLKVPADDSAVEMERVISFYDRLFTNEENVINLTNNVRLIAVEYFSYKKVMAPIVDFLNQKQVIKGD